MLNIFKELYRSQQKCGIDLRDISFADTLVLEENREFSWYSKDPSEKVITKKPRVSAEELSQFATQCTSNSTNSQNIINSNAHTQIIAQTPLSSGISPNTFEDDNLPSLPSQQYSVINTNNSNQNNNNNNNGTTRTKSISSYPRAFEAVATYSRVNESKEIEIEHLASSDLTSYLQSKEFDTALSTDAIFIQKFMHNQQNNSHQTSTGLSSIQREAEPIRGTCIVVEMNATTNTARVLSKENAYFITPQATQQQHQGQNNNNNNNNNNNKQTASLVQSPKVQLTAQDEYNCLMSFEAPDSFVNAQKLSDFHENHLIYLARAIIIALDALHAKSRGKVQAITLIFKRIKEAFYLQHCNRITFTNEASIPSHLRLSFDYALIVPMRVRIAVDNFSFAPSHSHSHSHKLHHVDTMNNRLVEALRKSLQAPSTSSQSALTPSTTVAIPETARIIIPIHPLSSRNHHKNHNQPIQTKQHAFSKTIETSNTSTNSCDHLLQPQKRPATNIKSNIDLLYSQPQQLQQQAHENQSRSSSMSSVFLSKQEKFSSSSSASLSQQNSIHLIKKDIYQISEQQQQYGTVAQLGPTQQSNSLLRKRKAKNSKEMSYLLPRHERSRSSHVSLNNKSAETQLSQRNSVCQPDNHLLENENKNIYAPPDFPACFHLNKNIHYLYKERNNQLRNFQQSNQNRSIYSATPSALMSEIVSNDAQLQLHNEDTAAAAATTDDQEDSYYFFPTANPVSATTSERSNAYYCVNQQNQQLPPTSVRSARSNIAHPTRSTYINGNDFNENSITMIANTSRERCEIQHENSTSTRSISQQLLIPVQNRQSKQSAPSQSLLQSTSNQINVNGSNKQIELNQNASRKSHSHSHSRSLHYQQMQHAEPRNQEQQQQDKNDAAFLKRFYQQQFLEKESKKLQSAVIAATTAAVAAQQGQEAFEYSTDANVSHARKEQIRLNHLMNNSCLRSEDILQRMQQINTNNNNNSKHSNFNSTSNRRYFSSNNNDNSNAQRAGSDDFHEHESVISAFSKIYNDQKHQVTLLKQMKSHNLIEAASSYKQEEQQYKQLESIPHHPRRTITTPNRRFSFENLPPPTNSTTTQCMQSQQQAFLHSDAAQKTLGTRTNNSTKTTATATTTQPSREGSSTGRRRISLTRNPLQQQKRRLTLDAIHAEIASPKAVIFPQMMMRNREEGEGKTHRELDIPSTSSPTMQLTPFTCTSSSRQNSTRSTSRSSRALSSRSNENNPNQSNLLVGVKNHNNNGSSGINSSTPSTRKLSLPKSGIPNSNQQMLLLPPKPSKQSMGIPSSTLSSQQQQHQPRLECQQQQQTVNQKQTTNKAKCL